MTKLIRRKTLNRLLNNIKWNKTTKANEQEVDNKINKLIKIIDEQINEQIKQLNASFLLYVADHNVDKIKQFISLNNVDNRQLQELTDDYIDFMGEIVMERGEEDGLVSKIENLCILDGLNKLNQLNQIKNKLLELTY